MTPARVLVLAYGNPGRRDDGLGPACAAAVERWQVPGVTVSSDYQLTVEDAAAAAQHDAVLFVDAACTGSEPWALRTLGRATDVAAERRTGGVSFSSHSAAPEDVLALAALLFHADPAGYVLAVRGYEFDEFGEGLSPAAGRNLAAALAALEPMLRNRTLGADAAPAGRPVAAAAGSGTDR